MFVFRIRTELTLSFKIITIIVYVCLSHCFKLLSDIFQIFILKPFYDTALARLGFYDPVLWILTWIYLVNRLFLYIFLSFNISLSQRYITLSELKASLYKSLMVNIHIKVRFSVSIFASAMHLICHFMSCSGKAKQLQKSKKRSRESTAIKNYSTAPLLHRK